MEALCATVREKARWREVIYGSLLHGVGGGGVLCARSHALIEFLKKNKNESLRVEDMWVKEWHSPWTPWYLVPRLCGTACAVLWRNRMFLKETTAATLEKTLKRLCVLFCKPAAALSYIPEVTWNLFLTSIIFSSSAEKNPKLAVPPNPFLTQFLPTILLWSFAAMLPAVVSWSSYFEAHWTR